MSVYVHRSHYVTSIHT